MPVAGIGPLFFAWFTVGNATVAAKTANDTTTVNKALQLGNYMIKFSIEVDKGVDLSDNLTGKCNFYTATGLIEKTNADTRGEYKVSTLSWANETISAVTYTVPADDVIATLAGYYQVSITAGGQVKLLKQNATDSKGAGASYNDVTAAKAWIHITAGSGDAALSWSITGADPLTEDDDQADGFTAIGTSGDAGKLLGQFAVRPVNNTNGDDTYYNAQGQPVGEVANDITVAFSGINA